MEHVLASALPKAHWTLNLGTSLDFLPRNIFFNITTI